MADGKFTTNTTATRPRKANECIMSVKHLKPPENLFDEFWREGELALLFGAAGTGKSILAVQIAEAVARGRGIDGFAMTGKRHKVLYVDLKISERQFGWRYTNEGKQYKLSENFYRDRPAADEKLIDWLRSKIRENGFRVVVIDDLSAIRQTYDGTRETLKLMRELKQLKDELDMSVLVLANSREPRKGEVVSEADMMRSRVLCDVADSVFGIGMHNGNRYIIQTRVQNSAIKWHSGNAPVCHISRSDDAFLAFKFDERFVVEVNQETREMILNVKWRHDAGASYRIIADELGISKSKAARLCKMWTPVLEKDIVMESEPSAAAGGLTQEIGTVSDLDRSRHSDLDNYQLQPPATAGGTDMNAAGSTYWNTAGGTDWSAKPFLAALKRIPITDLKRGYDGYGREIFIQEEQYDGKPVVWYQYDSKGKLIRKKRDALGISIKQIDEPWIASVRRVASPEGMQR